MTTYRKTVEELQQRPMCHVLRTQKIAHLVKLEDGPLGLGLASRLADMSDLPAEKQQTLTMDIIDLLDAVLDDTYDT